MDWKIELVAIPVADMDRAKDFYVKIGFNADHDASPSPELRFIQLTPPGSACSICLVTGNGGAEPGSVRGMQMVVSSAQKAYEALVAAGVDATPVKDEGWGLFTYFTDPDGNKWALQELPSYAN